MINCFLLISSHAHNFVPILTIIVPTLFPLSLSPYQSHHIVTIPTRQTQIYVNIQVTWLRSPRSEVQALVCLPVRVTPWWVLLQHYITFRRLLLIVECGIMHFLCTMCALKVWASSSSLGYLSAKFHFFCDPRCWASPWRKIVH